jgi:hypothetical protein
VSAARLAAAKLIRRNRGRHGRRYPAGIVLLGLALLSALLWVEAAVVPSLDWLRSHGLLCGGLAAFAVALLIARRRAIKRAELARSWLAAVPVPASTARWEALLIETLPAIAAIGLLTLAGISYSLVLLIAGRARILACFAVWAYLCGGILLGVIGSFLVPQPKPVDLPPGSRYVPQQRPRRSAKIQPSLRALGGWPIRQAFAWAQPKIVARVMMPILVMMPLGTTADTAMVAIALCGIVGVLLLLCSAVNSAGRLARRWLAPVPVQSHALIRAFLLPACAVMAAAGAIEASLLLVFNLSLRASAEIGTGMAVAGCLIAGIGVFCSARRS